MKKSNLLVYALICMLLVSLPVIAVNAADGDDTVSADSASDNTVSDYDTYDY